MMMRQCGVVVVMLWCTLCLATVNDNYAPVEYNCDGSTKTFRFTWPIASTSDVVVTHIDGDGEIEPLTEVTHYAVSRYGNDYTNGGTVTTVSAYPSGEKIVVSRATPKTQDRNAAALSKPAQIEGGLDKTARTFQEMDERLGLSLHAPAGSVGVDMNLPDEFLSGSGFPYWNGSTWTFSTPATMDAALTSWAESFLQYSSTSEAVEGLGMDTWLVPTWSDYGAIADDGLDDTTAFQECIDDAIAQGKGVLVPGGTYNIDETLLIGQTGAETFGFTMVGVGQPKIVWLGSTSDTMVEILSCTGLFVGNLWLDANDVVDVNGVYIRAQAGASGQLARFEALWVENCPSVGIDLNQVGATLDYFQFRQCYAKECGVGLRIRGGVRQVDWHGGAILACDTYGLDLWSGLFTGYDCFFADNGTCDIYHNAGITESDNTAAFHIFGGGSESPVFLKTSPAAKDGQVALSGNMMIGFSQDDWPWPSSQVADYNVADPLLLIGCKFQNDFNIGARASHVLSMNTEFTTGSFTGTTTNLSYFGIGASPGFSSGAVYLFGGAGWPNGIYQRDVDLGSPISGIFRCSAVPTAPQSYYHRIGDWIMRSTLEGGHPIGWIAASNGNLTEESVEATFTPLPALVGGINKNTDYAIQAADNGCCFSNGAATGAVTFTLPPAIAGMRFSFRQVDPNTITVDPNGTEYFRYFSAGEAIDLEAIGSSLEIACHQDGVWDVERYYLADVAWSTILQGMAALTPDANQIPYWVDPNTISTTSLTTYMRTLLADANEAEAQETLGLEIGVDVQAYDPNLGLLSGLDPNAGDIPYFPSTTTMSSTPTTSYTRGFLADANSLEASETLQVGTYNVLHYGADNTGATDCATAFQAAVDAAEEVNGVVVFPAGRYMLDSVVTIDDDVTLCGAGGIIVSTGGYFSIQGAISGSIDLTDDVAAGDPNLTVASGDEAGFSAGDKILLHASALSNGQDQWWHERHIVRGTEDGIIQLEGHARFRYDLYGGEVGDPEESGISYYQEPEVSLYSPIKVTIQGLKFEGSTTDYSFLDIDYAERLTIRDCEFYATVASRTAGYVWTCFYSQDILLTNCRFYDASDEAKGPRFYGCQNVKITNCEWFNNRARPLYFLFCQGVEVLGCTAFKNDGYIFTFEATAEVDCSHNKIQWVPDSIVDFETSATSRPGIFIIGSEDVRIIGNQITDCHGEGAIYLRTANYAYARDGAHVLYDDYFVVSNNIIRDLTNGLSTASLYAKSMGHYWTISNNVFVTKENAIGLYGEYRYIDVFDNQIHNTAGNLGIVFGANPNTPGNEAGHIRIRRNRIYRDVYFGTNAYSIVVQLDPDTDCEIADNEIWSLNSEDSAPIISVGRNASGAFGEANIRITNNRIYGTNTSNAQVGINIGSTFTGYPDPGCVIIRDNDVNVPGAKYGTGADDYTIEEVTTLEVNADDPNTLGLSKCFKTANTNPTTITDLGGALEGQEVTIIVNDGVTTFDFTSSGFEGRSADWTAEAGDVARFKYDGTQWYLLGILGTNAEYTVSNVTPDRAYDANATDVNEVADVLGTLIADLKEAGIID